MIYKNCIGTINDDEVRINNNVIKTSHIKAINYFYIPSGKTEFFLILSALFFILTSFFINFYVLFSIGIIGLILSKVNFYYDYFLVIKTDTDSEPIIEEIKTSKKCDVDSFIEKMHCYESPISTSL